MIFKEKKEYLAELNPEAYLFDGYEDAFIGIVHSYDGRSLACYDYYQCINILKNRDGMTYSEAVDYFDFNTMGCQLGPNTPVILKSL